MVHAVAVSVTAIATSAASLRLALLLAATMLAAGCTEEGLNNAEALGQPCLSSLGQISCPHATMVENVGIAEWSSREVHFQVPSGTAPSAGWPAVIFFQGSFISAETVWTSEEGDSFGAYHVTETFRDLLDAGFAVLSPETRFDGVTYWDTNVPPFSWDWELSDDDELMQQIFEGIDDGSYPDLDGGSLFAMGISSGGYMTSRMAVSYPGRFRALAVHSASYATCSGPICDVPDAFDSSHPPTLFLHGNDDVVVDVDTALDYADSLEASGIEVDSIFDDTAGHEWLPIAPRAITAWFSNHSAPSADPATP